MIGILRLILAKLLSYLYLIPSTIYDLVISKLLTNFSYERLNKLLIELNPKSILDIGVGTGGPLKHIWNDLPICSVLGVDIDASYVKKAQNIFKDVPMGGRRIEIREQNFYTIDKKEKYDAVVFSSSFMLMPDREAALQLAKEILNKNGRIYFILTLQPDSKKNTLVLRIIEAIKPKIKYLTTIDFGKITYENEFEQLLAKADLTVTHKEKLYKEYNIPTKIFRVFVYETRLK